VVASFVFGGAVVVAADAGMVGGLVVDVDAGPAVQDARSRSDRMVRGSMLMPILCAAPASGMA